MSKIVCRKHGLSLTAVDTDGLEAFRKIPDGRDVMIEVKQSRNTRHFRLYWALVRFVAMHCPIFEGVSENKIHVAIKLATGLADTFIDIKTGKACFVPRSIAFESLDQSEFNKFFSDACNVIAQRWMPIGSTSASVRDELIRMVDGPQAIQRRA